MNITPVAPERINELWPVIGPFIEKALTKTHNDCFTADDIRMALRNFQMGAWIAADETGIHGVAVIETIMFPRKRVLNVPFVGGRNMSKWGADMLRHLENHARMMACDSLTGGGRKGWMSLGFEQIGVVLEKRL